MTLSHQRPLAILFAATLTVALWSPTLSAPMLVGDTAAASQTAPTPHFVFASASAAPVLM